MSGKSEAGSLRKKSRWTSGYLAILVGSLCLVVIGMVAFWNLKHRERLAPIQRAKVEFITAPGTVDPGVSSHFVIEVQDKKDAPMPGRVMDVTVSPVGKAEIVAISGDSAQTRAVHGTRAKGRTDASGRLDVIVRAAEPGKYTLVALDSASNREGTKNFRAVEPEG